MRPRRYAHIVVTLVTATLAGACADRGDGPPRAMGYVEATEVRVGAEAAGRLLDVPVQEGDRVAIGTVLARLDTGDVELALRRARAERDQAAAQLRLVEAGARVEDVRQAQAQLQSAEADVRAAASELESAEADLARFEALLQSNAGSRKQRDDAATRRDVAAARVAGARERAGAAREQVARLQAGSRPEEIAAARARLAALDAQVAALEKNQADAVLISPVSGVVTAKTARAGEIVARGAPVVTVTDLDAAWANVYVDEPVVPTLRLGQSATLVTDAGQRLPGTITFISPRAEFTPRNVQTAQERSKLVYRIKVSVDNREGILKPGMPVEAEFTGGEPAS
jgi:HlyD family secretion protein